MTLILLHQCNYLRSNIPLQPSRHTRGAKNEAETGAFTQGALPQSSFINRAFSETSLHSCQHILQVVRFLFLACVTVEPYCMWNLNFFRPICFCCRQKSSAVQKKPTKKKPHKKKSLDIILNQWTIQFHCGQSFVSACDF